MEHGQCNLCKTRSADKKNSHIIPKFLCKGLFELTAPRHSLSIDRTGIERKVQDTPKEDYILCVNCEKRIAILETYFARLIEQIHNYSNLPNKFNIHRLGNQEFIECKNIHPTLFKLFIYSLIWRASISNLFEFENFKLSQNHEEVLRSFLNTNLTVTQKSLLNSINNIDQIPQYHTCLIKPKTKRRGIFSAYNMSTFSHLLLLVDFGLFFYTDENSIGPILKEFSNWQNQKVIIALGDELPWQELNKLVVSIMLKGKPVE